MRVLVSVGVVLALVVAAAAPARAQAQITTGVIQGLVRDSTGAVVPGVTVEANTTETNLTQTRVTGTDGRFVFLQLPPGRYRVTFSLAGFGTVHQDARDGNHDRWDRAHGRTIGEPGAATVGLHRH